jgi:hypothetical protein
MLPASSSTKVETRKQVEIHPSSAFSRTACDDFSKKSRVSKRCYTLLFAREFGGEMALFALSSS